MIAHASIESIASHKIDITKVHGQSYDGAQCMSYRQKYLHAPYTYTVTATYSTLKLLMHANFHQLEI